ncbi:hypothetical protein ACGRHY_09235 [Streptomyces sp. HK10]|uniref:hypothetical protein n=1 Tax=Streptomyces sp. HK10 TaxID=3373255 RepID=UPI003749D1F4
MHFVPEDPGPLPEDIVPALRGPAGERGVSALVATVVGERLRNQATATCLAEYESEHGSFTEAELRAAADMWDRAEQKEKRWRAGG